MDQQTALNGSDRPARDLKEHLSGMFRDASRLADLQVRLLVAELRQSRAALLCAVGCWLTACLMLLAMLPIAFAGLGLWLADVTQLTVAGGLATVAAAVSVLAGSLGVVGWWQFCKQVAAWERTRRELRDNIQALRHAFSSRAGRESTNS